MMSIEINESKLVYCRSAILCNAILLSIFILNGCATQWKDSGSYQKTTQTKLMIESIPPGKAFVNNKFIGYTPITTPLEYGQEVKKKTREVSYWITQPGWSLLLSIVSLGIYVPFSLIPVDVETSLEPTNSWQNNEFSVRVESEGYNNWQDKILLTGQDSISLQPKLNKTILQGE